MSVVGNIRGKINRSYKLNGKINRLYELRGYSAYEVAVLNGFEGTEEEWLASLKSRGFSYNFTTVCKAPEVDKNGFVSYDSYTNPQDAQAIDHIVQNWGKEPMSVYIQGYPVIGVDINNHHLKVLWDDRYIYTFNWWVSNNLVLVSLWAHAVVEIAYKKEILEYDHIVEQGRSNGWDYRKWANGDAECWRTVTATVKTTDWKDSGMMSFLSYGLFWTRDVKIQLPYPFSFASRPVETACLTNGTVWFPLSLISTSGGQVDKTDSYRICTYKTPEQDIEVTISFHIIGKWE